MGEPIEMLFEMWTRVSPRNHVLDGGVTLRCEGTLEGKEWPAKDMPGHI